MTVRVGRAELAALAGEQWGMLTTSQAAGIGVSKMALSRLAESGELERMAHGVYAVPATASDDLVLERTMWLTLDPGVTAGERLREPHQAGVLSHESAARLLGLGDLVTDVVTITVPTARRTRRAGLKLRTGVLEAEEVQLVDGLPVTRAARMIADLVEDGVYDLEHLTQIAAQALERGLCDEEELREALLKVSAEASGPEALQRLLDGADAELVEIAATRVLTSPAGQQALSRALQTLIDSPAMAEAMRRAAGTVRMTDSIRVMQDAMKNIVPSIDWPTMDVSAILNMPSLKILDEGAAAKLAELAPKMPEISMQKLAALDKQAKQARRQLGSSK
jgi:predicted transcriptional regulator of viral defense system